MSRGGRFGKYGDLKRKARLRQSRLAKGSHAWAKPTGPESKLVRGPRRRRKKKREPIPESPEEQQSE